MKLSSTVLLTTVAAAMLASTAAEARPWHHRYENHYYGGPDVVYVPNHSYYSNQYYYDEQPVYAARPQPVYAQPTTTATRVVCRENNNALPTIIGGVGGGLLGSTIGHGRGNLAAIVGGTLIGGVLGNNYSSYDRDCTQEVFETADVGRPYTWQNPQGADYTITPTRDYNTDGRYCREYQANVDVGGRRQQSYGTACQQPDGSWEIVN